MTKPNIMVTTVTGVIDGAPTHLMTITRNQTHDESQISVACDDPKVLEAAIWELQQQLNFVWDNRSDLGIKEVDDGQ